MAANVAAAFNLTERTSYVEDTLGEYSNLKKINDFLEGKSKHKHIFIYYQRPDIPNEFGEPIDTKGDPKLMITTGEHEDMRIKSRAVYFLRNVPDQKAVKVEVGCDHELLFGEMSGNPLQSLNTGMQDVFGKLIQGASSVDWASCDREQTHEFRIGFEKFTKALYEGIKSLTSGIELASPEPRDNIKDIQAADIATNHPEIAEEYEKLLDGWCQQIEKYLEDASDGQAKEVGEPGPRTELEYWLDRLQNITSITEQLKTKERKMVFSVLGNLTRQEGSTSNKARQTVFNGLRRWKQVDIAITEAFNEAKDNVKYLTTLDKFIAPLYEGDPASIIDSLPALMNAVKMIYTIARYYNTTDRMTTLLTKITNQMITNCRHSVLQGEAPDVLWSKDPIQLIKNLETHIKLNDAYQEQYQADRKSVV